MQPTDNMLLGHNRTAEDGGDLLCTQQQSVSYKHLLAYDGNHPPTCSVCCLCNQPTYLPAGKPEEGVTLTPAAVFFIAASFVDYLKSRGVGDVEVCVCVSRWAGRGAWLSLPHLVQCKQTSRSINMGSRHCHRHSSGAGGCMDGCCDPMWQPLVPKLVWFVCTASLVCMYFPQLFCLRVHGYCSL